MRCRLLLLVVFGLLAGRSHAQEHDRWYVMDIQGQRAGWVHTAVKTDGDRVRSLSEMRLALKRGAATVKLSLFSEFVETADGDAISMTSIQEFGTAPLETRYTFNAGDVTVVTVQNGRETTSTAPLPEGIWLTPAKADWFAAQRFESGAKEIVVRTIDPSMGLAPMTITTRVLERTTVEALGKVVPALRCETTTSVMPGVTTVDYYDNEGIPIRTTIDMGGLSMVMLAADREVALAKMDPPEIMASTMVTGVGKIDDPRRSARASYVLSLPSGSMPDLPSTGAQSCERLDDGSVRVSVDLRSPAVAPRSDATEPAYTKPSAMIDSDDPEIRKLVERATAGLGPHPARRAEAMRRFVYDFISEKGLGVGFATASEIARCGEGDCSEHGTLLAAMLRADGIPSRVASGVLYVDEFLGQKEAFGYHMWSQALLMIDGSPRWVDLDATFPHGLTTDATHIALSVSGLQDSDPQNAMVALAPLLGRLAIKVESVE